MNITRIAFCKLPSMFFVDLSSSRDFFKGQCSKCAQRETLRAIDLDVSRHVSRKLHNKEVWNLNSVLNTVRTVNQGI